MNRTVIALLMNKLGARNAELAVRGWVANLAQPVFATEQKLLLALESGECAVGIVSSTAALENASSNVKTIAPADAYVDVEAAGITRHARNPDAAATLIDWMLQSEVQTRHAAQTSAFPVQKDAVGSHNVAAAALGHDEAAQLADRARYR